MIVSYWGLSIARSRVVSTGAGLHVINLPRSYSVPWNDVSSFERVDDGSVECDPHLAEPFGLGP